MAREQLWLVRCIDRDGDDVDDLRQKHMAGHLAHIESIVDHIAMAGPLKDLSGAGIVGSLLAYRTDDLEEAKLWLEGDPYARCGIWDTVEWSCLVLAAGTLAGGVTW
ncbi:MAG: YciI family protein [Luminiphilus sp.]|nr:YciI family protein [Luminiphilus sp.]